jgi:VWFA-related protein
LRRRKAIPLALSVLLATALLPAGAQQPPEGPRIKIPVRRVVAPLVVTDGRGEYIYDLTQEEVTVLDNGVPQQIEVFEHDSRPISLVILVDTSRRVSPLLDRVRKSGILFTRYILGSDGEAAILTFDDTVRMRLQFTADEDDIIRTLTNLAAGGLETRLADALEGAVKLLEARPEGRRRVIVALTEPADEGSQVAPGVPLRRAQISDISVFTISMSRLAAALRQKPEDTPVQRSPYPEGTFPTPGRPGSVQTPTTEQQQHTGADLLAAVELLVTMLHGTVRSNLLEVYSAGTGAVNYSPGSRGDLEEAIHRIGQDLHNQYVVSYRPSNTDIGFHRLEVRVSRRGTRVRTRSGYYVGTPPEE